MGGTVEPPCVDISVVSRAKDGWDSRTFPVWISVW